MRDAIVARGRGRKVEFSRRPRSAELAARAGVSIATVDRVINGRGGVRRETADRVARALEEILSQARGARGAAARARIDVLLPAQSGRSTEVLAEAIAARAAEAGGEVAIGLVPRFDPGALAAALRDCARRGTGGVAFQGVDHPEVRGAMDELSRAGIPVVTLCSDVGHDRLAYVGVDNRAAGRTAGWLMGRLCSGAGSLAVVWGGELYRSHEEREAGFRSVLRAAHPALRIIEMVNGRDDAGENYARMRDVASATPDLRGVYCVGGGQAGVARAIEDAGLAGSVAMVGHNFNEETRPFLLSGAIDALVHQDMGRIARAALDCFARPPRSVSGTIVPVEIVTRENMPPC